MGAGYHKRAIDGESHPRKAMAPRRVRTRSSGMAGHQEQPRVQDRAFAICNFHRWSRRLGVGRASIEAEASSEAGRPPACPKQAAGHRTYGFHPIAIDVRHVRQSGMHKIDTIALVVILLAIAVGLSAAYMLRF